MSRPLRIEYPGAWYHLMNRGRRKENIFENSGDRQLFLTLLQEASVLWDVRVSAFCMMDNHYHLLVQTPQGNLSRFMRHLNGVYTQRFNHLHGYEGQLFRGRYKSILVAEDSYLIELIRYIHRNPARANMVENLKDYQWSSHQGYLSKAKKWDWLHKNVILAMLTSKQSRQREAYLKLMGEAESEKLIAVLQGNKWPSFLGGEDFISWVKEQFFQDKFDRQVPESFQLAPDSELIITEVCRCYRVEKSNLLHVQRGRTNEAKDVAIYLCRTLRNDTLKKLGEKFGLTGYGPAGSAVDRIRRKVAADEDLAHRLEQLRKSVMENNKLAK